MRPGQDSQAARRWEEPRRDCETVGVEQDDRTPDGQRSPLIFLTLANRDVETSTKWRDVMTFVGLLNAITQFMIRALCGLLLVALVPFLLVGLVFHWFD